MWKFIEQNVRRQIHTHARVSNVHCVKSFRTQIDKAYNSDIPNHLLPTKLLRGAPIWKVLLLWTPNVLHTHSR